MRPKNSNYKLEQCADMTQKQCEQCSEPFFPREAKQRFCCRDCSIDWFANERRQALEFFRQSSRDNASTYFDQAQAIQNAPGGRWAQPPAHVTGTAPISPHLPAPKWSRARLPDEPPLGFRVDEMPGFSFPANRNENGDEQ